MLALHVAGAGTDTQSGAMERRYLRFALVGDSCDGMLYSSVLGPVFYQVFVPQAKCRYLRFALVGDCVTACCFIYDLLSLFFLPSMAWRPSLHVCLMDNQVLYPCGTWNMERNDRVYFPG